MSDHPMPPADPTPPLTAVLLAAAEQCFSSGDSGADVEAIGWELLAAHAALTAENRVLAGKLADIEADAQAATVTGTSAVIAALTAQLAARTAERDAARAAVRGWHEAMCEYREGDVRGSVDKVHRAEAALVATLAAPTEG